MPAHDPSGWCVLNVRRMSPTRLVAALRDARAQRNREAELEDARQQAEQQNAGKSRFLANMSHELRTPLNAIMGFSGIMRQKLFGPMSKRYAEYADLIHESGAPPGADQRCARHVEDRGRAVRLAREDFDARDAIAAVTAADARPSRPGGDQPAGRLSAESLEAEADRRAIKQIAFNLISALKFTPRAVR